MHPAFTVYHFLPMTHVRGALPILERLLDNGHRPVLDLEDSVSCVFDPIRNDEIKDKARSGLLRLSMLIKDRPFEQHRILVRINQRDSHHHAADLDVLARCHASGFSPSILLPKTHCSEDLLAFEDDFAALTGYRASVVPLIESVSGLDSLESIITAMPLQDRIAVFGYFDYALDAGHWPIMEQMQSEYWLLFNAVRSRAESLGCSLINAPHASWQRVDDLVRIKSYLVATGHLPTGMCSLGMPQSAVLMRDVEPNSSSPISPSRLSLSPKDHAAWVVREFETARCHQRSFAVADEYFVTPHEYQLAKRYLQNLQDPL
jgi:citrate lyase subunit beta/citryl-CoA lyase